MKSISTVIDSILNGMRIFLNEVRELSDKHIKAPLLKGYGSWRDRIRDYYNRASFHIKGFIEFVRRTLYLIPFVILTGFIGYFSAPFIVRLAYLSSYKYRYYFRSFCFYKSYDIRATSEMYLDIIYGRYNLQAQLFPIKESYNVLDIENRKLYAIGEDEKLLLIESDVAVAYIDVDAVLRDISTKNSVQAHLIVQAYIAHRLQKSDILVLNARDPALIHPDIHDLAAKSGKVIFLLDNGSYVYRKTFNSGNNAVNYICAGLKHASNLSKDAEVRDDSYNFIMCTLTDRYMSVSNGPRNVYDKKRIKLPFHAIILFNSFDQNVYLQEMRDAVLYINGVYNLPLETEIKIADTTLQLYNVLMPSPFNSPSNNRMVLGNGELYSHVIHRFYHLTPNHVNLYFLSWNIEDNGISSEILSWSN